MDIYIDITYGYFGVGWVYRGEFFRGTLFERAVIHSVDFLLKVYLLRLGYGPSRVLSVVFLFFENGIFLLCVGWRYFIIGSCLGIFTRLFGGGIGLFFCVFETRILSESSLWNAFRRVCFGLGGCRGVWIYVVFPWSCFIGFIIVLPRFAVLGPVFLLFKVIRLLALGCILLALVCCLSIIIYIDWLIFFYLLLLLYVENK